ncbi:MAG TPA: 50S ribosomal protein L22 [Patescibacteria group bacterium]|nr:50S ribosomal protein L22 [Patescibacteria group bacterium]
MEIIAQTKFVRQTPRKLRLVAAEVRGLKALEAEIILKSFNKKAARLLLKTLRQGIANAENNFHLKKDDLKIKRLEIGEGPQMKRYRFVAKGRVHQILKKMAHIKIILEGEEEKKAKKSIKKEKKPISTKVKKGKKRGTKS